MSRQHAESHRRIKLIGAEFDRLLNRLRSASVDEGESLIAELAQTAEQSRKQPDLVEWASFLDLHAHLLRRGGATGLLQSALALSTSSLVTLAAEEWVLAHPWKAPWFRRIQRPKDFRPGALARVIDVATRKDHLTLFLPDGERALAVVAKEGREMLALVRLVDGSTRLLGVARKEPIVAMTLAPGGQAAVVSGPGGPMEIVDLSADGARRVIGSVRGQFTRLILSPGRIAALGADGTVAVLDRSTSQWLTSFRPPGRWTHDLGLSEDGERVVTADDEGQVILWHAATGERLRTLEAHDGAATRVAMAPDGRTAISAGLDARLRLWDLDSGACVRCLEGHEGDILALELDAQAGRALSSDSLGAVRLWDLKEGASDSLVTSEGEPQSVLLFLPGDRAASGGAGGSIKLWELGAGESAATLGTHDEGVLALALCKGGTMLASSARDHTLRLWHLDGARAAVAPSAHRSVRAVDADGARALSVGPSGDIEVWDLTENRRVARAANGSDHRELLLGRVRDGLAVVDRFPTGTSLLGAVAPLPYRHELEIWDVAKGELRLSLHGHRRAVRAVALHPDGKRLAAAGGDPEIRVWDLRSGACTHTLDAKGGASIALLAFHPDGSRLVAVDWRRELTVWDVNRGRCVRRLQLGDGGEAFASMLVLPGAERVVVGGMDGSLDCWELESGRRHFIATGHDDAVRALSLSDDGKLIASVSEDKTLRIWSVGRGRAVARWDSSSPLAGCAFLSGDRLAVWPLRGEVFYLKFNDWGPEDERGA